MSQILEVRNLHKSFFGRKILDGVSLEFARGQTTVILGESGTGKSVLLKCLCGLLTPDEGSIHWEGDEVDPTQWDSLCGKITYVFQMGALFDSLSVFDNVAFPLVQMHHNPAEIKDRVQQCLADVGLPDVGSRMPAQLSGGMRKRVALARGIVTRPKIVLYDEPTTGLDPVMTAQVGFLIQELKQKYDVSGIVVTHDIKSAMQVADDMIMLYDGKVQASGTRAEILESEDPILRQFLQGEATGPIDPLRARN